jgi:hypothetical protein
LFVTFGGVDERPTKVERSDELAAGNFLGGTAELFLNRLDGRANIFDVFVSPNFVV